MVVDHAHTDSAAVYDGYDDVERFKSSNFMIGLLGADLLSDDDEFAAQVRKEWRKQRRPLGGSRSYVCRRCSSPRSCVCAHSVFACTFL